MFVRVVGLVELRQDKIAVIMITRISIRLVVPLSSDLDIEGVKIMSPIAHRPMPSSLLVAA